MAIRRLLAVPMIHGNVHVAVAVAVAVDVGELDVLCAPSPRRLRSPGRRPGPATPQPGMLVPTMARSEGNPPIAQDALDAGARLKAAHEARLATGHNPSRVQWAVICSVVLFGAAVASVWGLTCHLKNAKTGEARAYLAILGKGAAEAYARNGELCPSTSRPVPASLSAVRGRFYTPTVNEFAEVGFGCLGTTRDSEVAMFPRYFQYNYRANATSFDVIAHGDLDGDGKMSTLILRGKVENGRVVLANELETIDEDE